MTAFPLTLLALAAGIYLLLKARKELTGKLFEGLAGFVIILSIAYLGFLFGRGIKDWKTRDKDKASHYMQYNTNAGSCPHCATTNQACGGSCGGNCDKSCGGACGDDYGKSACCAQKDDSTTTCTGMKGDKCCMDKGDKGPKGPK